jgi:hypothetical protein
MSDSRAPRSGREVCMTVNARGRERTESGEGGGGALQVSARYIARVKQRGNETRSPALGPLGSKPDGKHDPGGDGSRKQHRQRKRIFIVDAGPGYRSYSHQHLGITASQRIRIRAPVTSTCARVLSKQWLAITTLEPSAQCTTFGHQLVALLSPDTEASLDKP